MADGPEVAIRRLIKKQVGIAGLVCAATLASATLFCRGCSTHEMSHWVEGQDSISHALALGAFLSGLVFLGSLVVLVAGLIRLMSVGRSKPD